MITSLRGSPASRLGLAAHPEPDAGLIERAFDGGINYFFFYGPGHGQFIQELRALVRKRRQEVIVATGSGARKRRSLLAAKRKIVTALGAETLDVFFAEYVNAADDPAGIFGAGGVLDELQLWKADGSVRLAGATTHDRGLARRLAEDPRVDVLMHRYNMAHRKAAEEVFPTAIQTRTPVVAFTATRWGTLLKPQPQWSGPPPSAVDCYRYCLGHAAVQTVLTAPQSLEELEENLRVLESSPLSSRDREHWERFGDLVYGGGADAFDTRWP
jgi:aryl-alcohol dehydrogenase-like predicted oxidoreductase